MRAAIYDRYWHTMGGGERHSGMIAEVLSRDGVEVDLLGHSHVDRDELADRLGLDLSRTSMRTVPDKGDAYVSTLSAEYDLFVNATYMSVVAPHATRSAYLCFFPTPFDHDLPRWRRRAIRTLGPVLAPYRDRLALGFGTGWYPPEGGRRRQWTWTNGEGILHIDPGPSRSVQFDLGRPGMAEPVTLTVEGPGGVISSLTAQQEFRRHVVTLPRSVDGTDLTFRSRTMVPGSQDTRTLGVAVSRIRLAGTGAAIDPRAKLATRFPWLLRDLDGRGFLGAYDVILANSEFTRGWIDRLWHTDSDVLYPPIQVDRLHPAVDRTKVILSVGRFFEPGLGHAKRQLEMVRMFGQMSRDGQLDGWSMTMLGGCEDSQRPYFESVLAAAEGLPVTLVANAPRTVVEDAMSTASIFWSATGLGEHEERAPWAQEHFGMTTAEAMAGGSVPIVIDRAGQREIVRDGQEGFRWATPAELVDRTLRVVRDDTLRARLSAAAILRARDFSDQAFAARWHKVAASRSLFDTRSTP